MTSVWVAEHGWCHLNAAVDCCTPEIVGVSPELRRGVEASVVVCEGDEVTGDQRQEAAPDLLVLLSGEYPTFRHQSRVSSSGGDPDHTL